MQIKLNNNLKIENENHKLNNENDYIKIKSKI